MNTVVAPTGSFARNPDWQSSPEGLLEQVRRNVLKVEPIDASRLATALMGDAVATNVFMLGFAWQKGLVPLGEASLARAIELNGAAVDMNKSAFAWGRQAALDPATARVAAGIDKTVSVIALSRKKMTLDGLLVDRIARLTAYQNAAYARHYESFVREMATFEAARVGGERVTREIATSLYTLMAYKDEYEVARLFAETGFIKGIDRQYDGDYTLRFHLAPPLFAKRDVHGHLIKQEFGPWIATAFRWLAKAKLLRGSMLDPFGYSAERREERAAIGEFETLMRRVMPEVNLERLDRAIELARLPQQVRGFGHVKARNKTRIFAQEKTLLSSFFESSETSSEREEEAETATVAAIKIGSLL